MLDNPKHRFLVIGIVVVFVLLIGAFFAQSYLNAMNEQTRLDRQRLEMEDRAKQAELEHQKQVEAQAVKDKAVAEAIRKTAEEKKAADEAVAAKQKQASLAKCLSDAKKLYNLNWNSSCTSFNRSQEEKFGNCKVLMAKYYNTYEELVTYCRNLFVYVPPTGCSLTEETGKRWDAQYDKDQADCNRRYQ